MSSTVYLDYAATAAIRPPEVADAVFAYLRDIGATPGRSGHRRALDAGRLALRCRRLLAELLNVPGDPGRITFQLNATHALNTALFGVLLDGDRVVRTIFDHNAVRRPMGALVRRGVREDVLDVGPNGPIDLAEVSRVLAGGHDGFRKPARLLVLTHASNVTGAILPVRELAAMAHDVGTLVLLDLAQTAGHHPVDLTDLDVDLAAFSGHKGLLGPQGTGGLWVRANLEVSPSVFGGTGGDSVPRGMPEALPDHLEAGTQNAPGIAGLAAGLAWILAQGVHTLHARERSLKTRLVEGLASVPGVQLCSPPDPEGLGIVTFRHEAATPGELATMVERSHGIQGRAGLHCAPEIHEALGTLETGAFRLSIGWATTVEDIDAALSAVRELTVHAERP
jgi:cysteine desulfurase/selenocysteine lyase